MNDKVKPWNDLYSNKEFYYGIEPNTFLKAHSQSIAPGGKVLCLAEGEGRNAVYLAKQGFQVTAVDQSKAGLEKLALLARENSVTVQTIVADLAEFSIGEKQWDAIISIWCHVPPLLRKKLHHDVIHGLKNGGVMILESYHPRQLNFKTGGPPNAELMMTIKDLDSELNGLQFQIIHEIERDVQEGKGHSGLSAVTQVLARKP